MNTRPRRFSINDFIGCPNLYSRKATRKKRKPLDSIEAVVKVNRSRFVTPLAIVITLYGKGVTPAINTIQLPYSL